MKGGHPWPAVRADNPLRAVAVLAVAVNASSREMPQKSLCRQCLAVVFSNRVTNINLTGSGQIASNKGTKNRDCQKKSGTALSPYICRGFRDVLRRLRIYQPCVLRDLPARQHPVPEHSADM
jgi:hypothetical protein